MDATRRYIEVLAFVAVWMILGWILHLDVNAYLLIGVPLVGLFQRFIRRQPLRNLWVRDTPAFVVVIPAMIVVHTLIGVPLSFCWRASGTLVLPAAAHALIDSYRNSLL